MLIKWNNIFLYIHICFANKECFYKADRDVASPTPGCHYPSPNTPKKPHKPPHSHVQPSSSFAGPPRPAQPTPAAHTPTPTPTSPTPTTASTPTPTATLTPTPTPTSTPVAAPGGGEALSSSYPEPKESKRLGISLIRCSRDCVQGNMGAAIVTIYLNLFLHIYVYKRC